VLPQTEGSDESMRDVWFGRDQDHEGGKQTIILPGVYEPAVPGNR